MIEIRPSTGEVDEEESLAIYNAAWPWDAISMAENRSFRSRVTAWVDLLAPGRGSAFAAVLPWRPEVGLVHLNVLRAHRRRGVGSALYREVSGWLRSNGVHELSAYVPEDDPESMGFAQRRGFREWQRNVRLVLDLEGLDPPAVAPPEGIAIVTWAERPELIGGIYEVACEALPDIPGAEDEIVEPFEDWLEHEMRGSGDRPEATFVAIADDDVVGYAKFSLTASQPTAAHHDLTAVKRAWRRRGIAGALKRAQIAWAKEHGYERLITTPEVRNEPSRRMHVTSAAYVGTRSVQLMGVWHDTKVACTANRRLLVKGEVDYIPFGGSPRRPFVRTWTFVDVNCAEGGPNVGYTVVARNIGTACADGSWKRGRYNFLTRTTELKTKLAATASVNWAKTARC